jgi:hypothetical protein
VEGASDLNVFPGSRPARDQDLPSPAEAEAQSRNDQVKNTDKTNASEILDPEIEQKDSVRQGNNVLGGTPDHDRSGDGQYLAV